MKSAVHPALHPSISGNKSDRHWLDVTDRHWLDVTDRHWLDVTDRHWRH
jgi:hypothetical protein